MIDLIDRQAAIDAVINAFDRETLLTGFVRSIAVRAIRDMPSAQPEQRPEPKTVRDTLNSMTDEQFAEWLCHQIFPDYDEDDVINVMRYQSVRNFLKMDIKQTKEGTIC